MAKKSVKKTVKKSAPKSAKAKPAVKTKAKPAAKSAVKASAKKAGGSKSAAPAKKPASKASGKAKSSSAGKTAAKLAGAVAAVGAIAGVAIGKVKVASQSKTDVSSFFSPLDDRILIEAVKTELRTAGGLFIPDTVTDESGPKEGLVLAVGPGHRSKKGRVRPLDVKIGDTVVFEAYQGSPLKIGDREVTMLRESELLGVKND